ncbi:MAG: hypothetical protein RIQ89_2139 [Bacteroidota bacterium]
MKKIILLVFLLPVTWFGTAQIPAYYSTIDFSLNGDSLKQELSELITNTHSITLIYTPDVWNVLKQTDLDPNDTSKVLLIYGYDDNDATSQNDRSRNWWLNCTTSSCNGLWVREHVYPRSLGTPNLGFEFAGADAHCLRSIDNQMNSSRSNRPFDLGSGNAGVLVNGNFYPGDEWKGDVARMIMYMYLRYNFQCQPNNVGAGPSSIAPYGDMPDLFLYWNEADSVSPYEMNRNNLMEQFQGNRNPFIDNPYLAYKIWGGPSPTDPWNMQAIGINPLTDQRLNIIPTRSDGLYFFNASLSSPIRVQLINVNGQVMKETYSNHSIDFRGTPPGWYLLAAIEGDKIRRFKVVVE